MIIGKTIALTIWTFVSKVMSLLFNTLSRFVIVFLPRTNCLLISWLSNTVTIHSVFRAQEEAICHCFHLFPFYLPFVLSRIKKLSLGDDRGWHGWMVSPTWWTWVWVNSGRWSWTWRPGVLRFMGLQRVGHNWATELNWTEISLGGNPRQTNWGTF